MGGWWFVVLVAVGTARAGTSECTPAEAELFCALGATESNQITQAIVDVAGPELTAGAWVISGTSIVSLPTGSFAPGNGTTLAVPAVWIRDQATLEIDGTDVSLAANVYLCDDASLVVRDGSLRIAQGFPFQFWTWAAADSRIVLDNAALAFHEDDVGDSSFYMALRGRSVLDATSGGLTTGGGSWNLVVGDQASASIRDGDLLGEMFVAGSGSLTVERTDYVSMTVNTCDTTTTVEGVPAACDPSSSCFQPAHPLTTYTRASAPTIMLTDTRVFAWRVETHPGSSTTLSNVSPQSQLVVELAGLTGQASLTLPAGADPGGLTDRVVSVGTEPVLAWSMGATDGAEIDVGAGSVIAGVDVSGGVPSRVELHDSQLPFGRVRVADEGEITFVRSDVDALVNVVDGSLYAVRSTFTAPWSLSDRAWLADSVPPAAVDVRTPDGWLGEVALTAPQDGTELESTEMLDVVGSVRTSDGTVAATVRLRDDSGLSIASVELDESVDDDLLTSFALQGLAPGDYELTVAFDDGGRAPARRTVTVLSPPDGPPDDSGAPPEDTGAPPAPTETGADSGTPTMPSGGCGCQNSSFPLPWFGIVLLMAGVTRTRRP
ncbi:MAG: hypothetical protein AAF211_17215 [Myxococcota bacterium]